MYEAGKAGAKGAEEIPLDVYPGKSDRQEGKDGQVMVTHPPKVGLMRDEWIAAAHIHESALATCQTASHLQYDGLVSALCA